MNAYGSFLVTYSTTVLLLLAAFASGSKGLRKLHIGIVVATLVGLGSAIYFALQIGQTLIFDPTVQRIHRVFSTSVCVLLVPMAVTGTGILLGKPVRRPHRIVAMVLIVTALLASATGFWMKSTGEPNEAPPVEAPA